MNRTNLILLVLFVIVAAAAATLRVDYSRPNFEVMPDMKYTPAATSYAPNSVFPNGRTLQAPVPGTIARGALSLHYSATKEDAVRAGEELKNPYAAEDADPKTQAALAASTTRGANQFRVFCTACHGTTGIGDGPVAKRGFPPPPSLLTGKSLQMQDGQLFHILTYGQGSMSDFAGQISPENRWDLINFVRAMQQQAAPSTAVPVTNAAPTSDAIESPLKQTEPVVQREESAEPDQQTPPETPDTTEEPEKTLANDARKLTED